MENLLALKRIKVVAAFNTKDCLFKYAYTEKMLARNMFIEFYETLYEPGENEPIDDIVKYETSVGIIMYHEKIAYHFILLHEVKPQIYTTKQAVAPLQIYRLILDVVEIIENHRIKKLVGLLNQASIDTFTSLEFSDEPEMQRAFHDMILKKIQTLKKGIEENRLRSN